MTNVPSRIALIDDDESVIRAICRLLRSVGLEVRTFTSGEVFLGEIQADQYDCVVLDLHMPGIDGFEVQNRLGKLHPRLPVVIITGHDTPESAQRTTEAGACGYLRKPIDGRALLDTIELSIRRSRVNLKSRSESEKT